MNRNHNRSVTIIGAQAWLALYGLFFCAKEISDVSVYGKRSDMRLSQEEVGRSINLVITSRGVHALEQAGLLQKALDLVVPALRPHDPL